jgi:RNA polymerase sigma factor (TIGR02999 family)
MDGVNFPDGDITRLLRGAREGHRGDREKLAELVYAELHRIAARMIEAERGGNTVQATVLASDAYMGLVGQADRNWQNRAHFFAVAARSMRQILVDYSRKKHALKRGEALRRVEDPDRIAATIHDPERLLALDQAMTRLAQKDPRQAEVVELRYFGGLTEEEIAEVLNLSLRTVKREWSAARAWLFAELTGGPPPPRGRGLPS